MSQEKQEKITEKKKKTKPAFESDADVSEDLPKDCCCKEHDAGGDTCAPASSSDCGSSHDDNGPCEGKHGLEAVDVSKETSRELGVRGEAAACRFLEKRKYDILERNWRCFVGEVDIIANDEDGEIVFVEVKTRSSVDKGLPEEAVTPQKRDKYEKLAAIYLAQHPCDEAIVRFDVISILALAPHRALLRHHVNAFGAAC